MTEQTAPTMKDAIVKLIESMEQPEDAAMLIDGGANVEDYIENVRCDFPHVQRVLGDHFKDALAFAATAWLVIARDEHANSKAEETEKADVLFFDGEGDEQTEGCIWAGSLDVEIKGVVVGRLLSVEETNGERAWYPSIGLQELLDNFTGAWDHASEAMEHVRASYARNEKARASC